MKFNVTYYRPITDEEYELLKQRACNILRKVRSNYMKRGIIKNLTQFCIVGALLRAVKKDACFENHRWIDMKELICNDVIKPNIFNIRTPDLNDEINDNHVEIYTLDYVDDRRHNNFKNSMFIKVNQEEILDVPSYFTLRLLNVFDLKRFHELLKKCPRINVKESKIFHDYSHIPYAIDFWRFHQNGIMIFKKID